MTNSSSDLQLSALLCSRLCHDLIGPVSAFGNGLEFIEDEDAETRREAQSLLNSSAGQAVRRLKFYRLAYGSASGIQLSLDVAREAADELLGDKSIALDWPDPPDDVTQTLDSRQVRLVLNMILLMTDVLIRGGSVSVRLEVVDGSLKTTVVAVGTGANLDESAAKALADGARPREVDLSEIDPRTVQPFFTSRLAAGVGGRLTAAAPAADRVELIVSV